MKAAARLAPSRSPLPVAAPAPTSAGSPAAAGGLPGRPLRGMRGVLATAFRRLLVASLLASSVLSALPAGSTELPAQVTSLLGQCLASRGNLPTQAIDALQELVDRNDPAIRDLFAREAIRVGGGGQQGDTFKKLVYDAVDRRQFQLAERLAAEVADDLGDGVELVIRTGSSGSRHLQLNNQDTGAVRYDTLISDDDISFLGPRAEEAARRFNSLKDTRGLKNARVKGFSLSSITDPTSYDLLVQQIRDPDAFAGAAGFGKIREEIVEKGGAVILSRQGKNVVPVAQTVQDYVSRNAGSTLAEIMDVAAIASDLKQFGPLTMYASAIRQMGHAGVTEREKVKYLLRIYASMQAAGSFGEAASFGGRQVSYFSELGEQMMAAYKDKTGKAAQALLRRHDLLQIQLDAFESVMLSTTRKLQAMVAQAEREAGRGAVNIARHPELRRMIHELAAGFSLLQQTGHSRIVQDVIPGILKSLGGESGREAALLYKVLYTAAFDAATLTAEAAEQGVTRGVSTWTRARTPAGLIEGMAEAGQNGRQARLLLAEVGSERLPGKAADGARELQRIINESNGDTFLWKMLSSQTAQKLLVEGVALAPFAAWTMYQEWSRGEMKDLHDAAFVLIDFVPGGMTTKKLGTEGLTPGTVLTFAKEALYFTPAWPFVLTGDVLYLSWTLGGAVQLQYESEGLVDLLTYNGEFEDEDGRPVLRRLALPGGTTVDRKEIEPWLFGTKAVRVKHTLAGLEYYINNLSEKANKVLDNQFMANDPGIQQMRLAVEQHLDAINWDEAAKYFQQGNVGMTLGAYLNYLAGFEFVVSADKGKPWARLYENLKNKMVERRDVVAKEHMVPQLIHLAEQKRATLDAAKNLAEELGKLQQTFERMRGSALGVDLVKQVTAGAETASATLSNATAEERQLAAGNYWQGALASYRRILEISKTIAPAIADRTGYAQAKPLGFTWSGEPTEDLRKAEQSKAGFAADLARVTQDVRKIKGSEPKVNDRVDRQALGLLAEVAFPWRHALDSQDKAEPSSASFDKEYAAALDKVRALYATSGDLQARVDRGARIEPGQSVMPMDKAVAFKLVVDDAQLRRAIADGSLGLKWSTEPDCTLRPRSDRDQVSITCFQPEPVTVTLSFEQTGARAAKAALRLTLPVSIPDTLLQLELSPATVEAKGRLNASADIDARLLGGRFHYRWSCSNCQVDAADRASVGVTAPESEGSGTVQLEVLIEDRAGQTRRLTSKSASFRVTAANKKDGGRGDEDAGKHGVDGSKADASRPGCAYEYSEWGECVRATKTQARRVTAKTPAGCIERSEPKLEQGCTPPPTDEEKRNQYFNCLCRCSSGWASHIGVWYDPEGKTVPECKSSGPCIGGIGAFGCSRRHFFGGPSDCTKGCWEGAFGKDSYDPAKADKLRKDENKKHKQPLTVKIKASKNPADFGDIVELTAETTEGAGGYQWNWGGCAQDAKDASAKVLNSRDCKPCTASVTATDQDGDGASDSLTIGCTALTVKLSKEGPKEDAIPVGGKASLFAQVLAGDRPANGSFTYNWEPNPDVLYGNPDSPTYETQGGSESRNTATFRKLGSTPVWVTVLKQVGETRMTMGESEQIRIDVVSPKLKLSADRPSPMVGETVTVTVDETPRMGDDLLTFWWEYNGDVNNPGSVANVPNSRAWSYKPRNDKPVTITVHAKSRDNGDELDSETLTVTAQKAQVAVTGPRIAGPPPMIWKEGVGLVSIERQVAEHQRVEFAATVTPAMGDLRYEWRSDPSGCTLHSPSSRETGVTCPSTGSYTLTAAVKNADGAELGSGSASLSVTVSANAIASAKTKAEAAKLVAQAKAAWARKEPGEALALIEKAQKLDPKDAEIGRLLDEYRDGKARLDRAATLREEGGRLQNEKKLAEALERFKQAQALWPDPKLAEHIAKVEAVLKEHQALIDQAAALRRNPQAIGCGKGLGDATTLADRLEKVDAGKAAALRKDIATAATAAAVNQVSNQLDFAKGIPCLEVTQRLDPANPQIGQELERARQIQAGWRELQALSPRMDAAATTGRILEADQIRARATELAKGIDRVPPVQDLLASLAAKRNRAMEIYRAHRDSLMAELQAMLDGRRYQDLIAHADAELAREWHPGDVQMIRGLQAQAREKMAYEAGPKATPTPSSRPGAAPTATPPLVTAAQGTVPAQAKGSVAASASGTPIGSTTRPDTATGAPDVHATAGATSTGSRAGGAGSIQIEACVDGSDWLRVEGGRLVHEHRAFAQIGAHPDCPASHAVAGGGLLVNGQSVPATQLPYSVGIASLEHFETKQGRGTVRLDGAKGLLLDDDGLGGPSVYVVRLFGGATTAAPAATPAKPPVPRQVRAGNVGGVTNGPTAPTTFTFEEPVRLLWLQTYHWNNARGATPGRIGLRHQNGTIYGPWPTRGLPGQGGVPNAYWRAEPGVVLEPGTYTVTDSDPATWATNAQAGNKGFADLEVVAVTDATATTSPVGTAASPASAATPPAPAPAGAGPAETTALTGRWEALCEGASEAHSVTIRQDGSRLRVVVEGQAEYGGTFDGRRLEGTSADGLDSFDGTAVSATELRIDWEGRTSAGSRHVYHNSCTLRRKGPPPAAAAPSGPTAASTKGAPAKSKAAPPPAAKGGIAPCKRDGRNPFEEDLCVEIGKSVPVAPR